MKFFRSGLDSSQSGESAEPAAKKHEATVSQYFHGYVESGKPGFIYLVRKPIKSIRMFVALSRIPCLSVAPSADDVEGIAIRSLLKPRSVLNWLVGYPTAVLRLPEEQGLYARGASRRTLRKKLIRAERAGIHWEILTDTQRQREVLKLADDFERTHPDITYRNPDPENSDLFDYPLWMIAYSDDSHPLLLSVTAVSGELAWMAFYRTLGVGDDYSNARYLLFQVLVEHLVGRKVRYLISGASLALPNGLRHFQHMLGFCIIRLRLSRPVT